MLWWVGASGVNCVDCSMFDSVAEEFIIIPSMLFP